MTTLSIIEQCKALGAQYASVIAMADLLENLGSIEQATSEATAARISAVDQRDIAIAALAISNGLLATANEALAQAQNNSLAVISAAEADANDLRVAAQAFADSTLAVAHCSEADIQTVIDGLNVEAAEIASLIAASEAELAALIQHIADARAAAIASILS